MPSDRRQADWGVRADAVAACVESVRRAYPSLEPERVEVAPEGQNNLVLILNQSLVFRFPRYSAGVAALRREAALLKVIAGQVPRPVPVPSFVCLAESDTAVPWQAFLGYPMLQGEPLLRERMRELAPRLRQRLLGQLGEFLAALHHIPITDLPDATPRPDWYAEWTGLYAQIRHHVFPQLSGRARASTERHFAQLEDLRAEGTASCLIHGDFGTANLLYHEEAQEISGVLDWAGAEISDPALDIAALLASYGEEALAFLNYPGAAQMLTRARFYRGTFALQEALFGVRNQDALALASGLSCVEEMARR